MLSDEEKKAIDELKKEINNPVEVPTDKFNTFILYNIESARTILNLIEKQSKEIEELKNADLTTVYLNGVYDGEKKAKDKIKAKIEELEKQDRENRMSHNYLVIPVLQSLLEKE